jgi:hypothetical protein
MTNTTTEQISNEALAAAIAKMSDDDAAALMYCLQKGAKSKARGAMTRALNEFERYYRKRLGLPPAPPKPRAKRPKAA